MADVKKKPKEGTEVLFVRIAVSRHRLLALLTAHDAAAEDRKSSLRKTVERLITEDAQRRNISLPS